MHVYIYACIYIYIYACMYICIQTGWMKDPKENNNVPHATADITWQVLSVCVRVCICDRVCISCRRLLIELRACKLGLFSMYV